MRWAGVALILTTCLTLAACGSTGQPTRSANHAGTKTIAAPPNRGKVAPPNRGKVAPATGGKVAPPPAGTNTVHPTSPQAPNPGHSGPSVADIAGSYLAATADGGSLYIRSDGASRFRGLDAWACPTCTTAALPPIASLDFTLTSISSSGPGAYSAAGRITATSDPYWAAKMAAATTVGSPITLTITPGRHVTLSLLPRLDDLTFFSPTAVVYGGVTPCTVAAVTPPILAAAGNQHRTVLGVSCSVDGEWAAAQVGGRAGSGGWDEIVVLAGNGTIWRVVDRGAVCSNHDVTPSFYNRACASD
jgi:hypothetical protein